MIYSFYLLSPKEKRRKKEGNDPFFSLQNERKTEKEREEIRGLQGHEKEKDLVHHGDEQGLKTMRFYFELNDKCFCSKDDKLVLQRQKFSNYFLFLIAA